MYRVCVPESSSEGVAEGGVGGGGVSHQALWVCVCGGGGVPASKHYGCGGWVFQPPSTTGQCSGWLFQPPSTTGVAGVFQPPSTKGVAGGCFSHQALRV